MFIVTNRRVDESKTGLDAFDSIPSERGPNELRIAEATRSSAGAGWRIKVLPDQITPAMAKEVGLTGAVDPKTKAPIYSSKYVARKLLAAVNPPTVGGKKSDGKHLLFFVHGFNNDLAAVLERAEGFEKAYGVEVVAFSWPANGGGVHGTLSYYSDKRDAQASVGALDRCLNKIHQLIEGMHAEYTEKLTAKANEKFPHDGEQWDRYFAEEAERRCPFSVNMLLHSMGNYLYKQMFKSAVYRSNQLIFDNVLMVAADTNNDDHAQWVDEVPSRGRIFITINEHDRALAASRMKMGDEQKARLGHYPYNLTARRVVYIDFTNAPHVSDSHAYFEGAPLRNTKVQTFFQEAMNGQFAEQKLKFDIARNMYRFQ